MLANYECYIFTTYNTFYSRLHPKGNCKPNSRLIDGLVLKKNLITFWIPVELGSNFRRNDFAPANEKAFQHMYSLYVEKHHFPRVRKNMFLIIKESKELCIQATKCPVFNLIFLKSG